MLSKDEYDIIKKIFPTVSILLNPLVKAEGIDMTKEEAEAYLAEKDDVELDDTALQQVAGGTSSVADASQVRILSFHCGALGLN